MSNSLTAQKCCYCEALKLAPEDRSGAMRAMVESQNLQLEACKLLLASRASTPAEEMQRLNKIAQQDNSKEADMLTQVCTSVVNPYFLVTKYKTIQFFATKNCSHALGSGEQKALNVAAYMARSVWQS